MLDLDTFLVMIVIAAAPIIAVGVSDFEVFPRDIFIYMVARESFSIWNIFEEYRASHSRGRSNKKFSSLLTSTSVIVCLLLQVIIIISKRKSTSANPNRHASEHSALPRRRLTAIGPGSRNLRASKCQRTSS